MVVSTCCWCRSTLIWTTFQAREILNSRNFTVNVRVKIPLAECSARQFKKICLSKSFEIVLVFLYTFNFSLIWSRIKKRGEYHVLRNFNTVSILRWWAFQAKWLNPSEKETHLCHSEPQINSRLLTNTIVWPRLVWLYKPFLSSDHVPPFPISLPTTQKCWTIASHLESDAIKNSTRPRTC